MTVDEHRIVEALGEIGVLGVGVRVNVFDDERIFRVTVPEAALSAAQSLAASLEAELSAQGGTAVVVIRATTAEAPAPGGPVRSLDDPRVSKLVQLLASRSRTSEALPSLSYIPNNTANLSLVVSPRNHLVFGRRGAGKTALLLEARRHVEDAGGITVWVNMQPWRKLAVPEVFLGIQRSIITTLAGSASAGYNGKAFPGRLDELKAEIAELLDRDVVDEHSVHRLVPEIQGAIRQATLAMGRRLFVFLDDFYYVPRASQPDLLDLVHSTLRDADGWLKVASIRHLTRWFLPHPPVGLQTGQDADLIDLDLSLQNPAGAVAFLERVFLAYCAHAGIPTMASVLSREAFERLVFASGGVPRDFLTLAASALTKAQAREQGRQVGVTDVNRAAGDAARSKVTELEDDLASNTGFAPQAYQALTRIRAFCLDERAITYFRVDFRDKDRNPDEYAIVTRLLEARLLHLVDPSVSDKDKAGERSECYTLDLSQYSGSRLKQKLRVLDLRDTRLISKQTRVAGPEYVGSTAREVLAILRGGPLLPLASLSDLVSRYEPVLEAVQNHLKRVRSAAMDELVIALGRSLDEIASAVAELLDRGDVRVQSEQGIDAYVWAR